MSTPLEELIAAAREFCARVDAGEVRSKRTYATFAAILEKLDKAPAPPRYYPDDLNVNLTYILGMPNFQCAPIAHALRTGGAEIKTRSEDEQAAVLHWLIKEALDHPTDWRVRAGEHLKEIAERFHHREDADE